MATYRSEDVTLGAPAETVFLKLDNLQGLGEMIRNAPAEQIPADKRDMLEKLKLQQTRFLFLPVRWELLHYARRRV